MRVADSSVAHDDDPVGERDGFIDVVGDQQHGGAMPAAELANQIVHAQPGDRVQRCERLVEQKQLRLRNEGSGQRDPLRLAAGKLLGPSLFASGQVTSLSAARARSSASGPRRPNVTLRENALPRQQPVALEHDRAFGGHLDAAAVRLVQPRQQAQQGALAAAGGAEQDDEFVVVDGEVEVVQHDAITEPADDLFNEHARLLTRRGRWSRRSHCLVTGSPPQQHLLENPDQLVGEKAEDGIDHQADEDLVGLQICLGLGDQETEPLIGVDRFGGDQAQDAVGK